RTRRIARDARRGGALALPITGRRRQRRGGGRLSGPAVGSRCLPDPDRPHRVACTGDCRRANRAVASVLVRSGVRPLPARQLRESWFAPGTPGVLTTVLFATAMWDRLGAVRDQARCASGTWSEFVARRARCKDSSVPPSRA